MELLQKDIRYLKGVGEKRAELLHKLGVNTFYDLFYLFPRRYIDYSSPVELAFAPYNEPCVVKAVVLSKTSGTRINGGKTIFKVMAADDTASLGITFFNSEYTVAKLLVGEEYCFYGKLSGNMLARQMTSPSFIPVSLCERQQPIYPLTGGLSSNLISKYIKTALEQVGTIEDYMPREIIDEYNLLPLNTAIKSIHFGTTPKAIEQAKERLIFDEFFLLQLGLSLLDKKLDSRSKFIISDTDISPLLSSLPFQPTQAQLKAMGEIIQDLSGGNIMNRLLQGDVGSGKTLVGAAAMYCMAKNGFQSCIMAPTEILAFQHYKSLTQMFDSFGIKTALLTSSTKAKERRQILDGLIHGSINMLVGTHSIISDNVVFKNLGLCITDEQHRFGVKQRTSIAQKGSNPHILVMSATPIPRTLAMIIYTNMQISVLDEMPKGRKPVKTLFVGTDKRERMFGFVKQHIEQGYQTYIVLPAIEDNEQASELQSVQTYCDEVVKPLLPDARVQILHGKMKPKEKQAIMASFKDGNIDVLCSTTVIEVGVDVANAVLMIIENAERYGLSALHQLRGRVGRGNTQSWCILVSDHKSKAVNERLNFICSNQSGFAVSQYDLNTRGPGDFFGSRQHGLPEMKIAQFSEDLTQLNLAQTACGKILSLDSTLNSYPKLKLQLSRLFEGLVL